MKKLLLLLFIVFSFSIRLYAQALVIDSTRFITGNSSGTGIRFAIPTADKGILFVGEADGNPGGIIPDFPLGNANVLIGKIDSNQHISWIKVYGGSEDDIAMSACQTPDGGYAVLAQTSSNDGDVTGFKGADDLWLLRINDSGSLLWERCYGSSDNDVPASVGNTADSGFILLGATDGSDGDVPFHYGGFFSEDWLVIKTDSAGNKQWSKDIGGMGDELPQGSILAIDSSYYIVSSTNSNDHDCTDSAWHSGVYAYDDYYILKLDDTGKVLWDSSYGGSNDDNVNYAYLDARDSTIVVVGTTGSNDYMVTGYHGGGDMWVVKVNKNGALIWQKALGSRQEENGTGLCSTPDGGYAAYCTTFGSSLPDTTIPHLGAQDCWLFALDSSGNEIANKIFGGASVDESYSIVPYLSGYAATGFSLSDSFTEGSNYGRFSIGAFVSYVNYWPLATNSIHSISKNALSIYPNPSQDNVYILTPENEKGDLTILNTIGQIICTKQITTKDTNINIGKWANGLYIIKWQGEDGAALTTKLIKD